MGTLHEDVKALIEGASSSSLPGGIFDAEDIYGDDAVNGNNYKWAKAKNLLESNGVTLIAHGILRWGDNTAHQINSPKLAAEREFFTLYMYQDMGYEDINTAKVAIKAALHDQVLYPSDRELAYLQYVMFSTELKAQEYNWKPMKFLRFSVVGR